MIIAETDRLILREFDLSDGEAMDHVFSDPEVMRFGPGVRSPKWVREWLGRCMKTYEQRSFGLWAVTRKSEGAVVVTERREAEQSEGHAALNRGVGLLPAWPALHLTPGGFDSASATAPAAPELELDVIGYCGLTYFPDIGGRPEIEIGYRFARPHWGHGYATEAALAVRDYSFRTLGLPRLIALIDPANVASIRVAEKIGMTYEKDVMLEGYDHPDMVYVLASPPTGSTTSRLPPMLFRLPPG